MSTNKVIYLKGDDLDGMFDTNSNQVVLEEQTARSDVSNEEAKDNMMGGNLSSDQEDSDNENSEKKNRMSVHHGNMDKKSVLNKTTTLEVQSEKGSSDKASENASDDGSEKVSDEESDEESGDESGEDASSICTDTILNLDPLYIRLTKFLCVSDAQNKKNNNEPVRNITDVLEGIENKLSILINILATKNSPVMNMGSNDVPNQMNNMTPRNDQGMNARQ